jgi:hypothetical protein
MLTRMAQRGDRGGVELALSYGANIHVEKDWAIRWAAGNGHAETVQFLLEKGADPSVDNNEAIWWAVAGGHLEVVKLLLASNPDLDKPHRHYNLSNLIGAGFLPTRNSVLSGWEERRFAALQLLVVEGGLSFDELDHNQLAKLHLCKDLLRRAAKRRLSVGKW